MRHTRFARLFTPRLLVTYLWGCLTGLSVVLGIVLGGRDVSNWITTSRQQAVDAAPLVASTSAVSFAEPATPLPAAIRAAKISVGPERFVFPHGGVWVANSILLNPKTTVADTNVTLIARNIEGGEIDVSGQDGRNPGESGTDAGSAVLAAVRVSSTRVNARGGSGTDGSNGSRGADGRNGRCDGFGGYRGADRGEIGQPGKPGGNGGNGGEVLIASRTFLNDATDVAGGVPGKGGRGGDGGSGGRGCVGLGGSQSNQPDGPRGEDANDGRRGNPGAFRRIEINFENLKALSQLGSAEQVKASLSTPHPDRR